MARIESSTDIVNADGVRETYTFLEYVTIDDILLNKAQALAAELVTGKDTSFPTARPIKDFLIRVQSGGGST